MASALCIGLAGALVAASARGLLPLDRAAGALDLLMLVVALAGAALAGRARRPAPRGAPRCAGACRRPRTGPASPRSPVGRADAAGATRWSPRGRRAAVGRRPGRHAVRWRAMAYLDHAATTPMLPEAVEAYVAAARARSATRRPCTRPAARPAGVVEESRERVAAALGARPSEVIFTGGGTESDNLAVKGIYWARRAADPRRRRVLASAVEHHAVLDAVEWLARHEGAEVSWLPVDAAGRVHPDDAARRAGRRPATRSRWSP